MMSHRKSKLINTGSDAHERTHMRARVREHKHKHNNNNNNNNNNNSNNNNNNNNNKIPFLSASNIARGKFILLHKYYPHI